MTSVRFSGPRYDNELKPLDKKKTSERKMRYTPAIAMLFFVGCIPADEATPKVSEVEIPESHFNVVLYKPKTFGYFYGIFGHGGIGYNSYGTRDLGPVDIDETAAPIIRKESPGVYKVVWGSGDKSAYVVIDVEKRLIVEDSNPDNERNQPLVLERN